MAWQALGESTCWMKISRALFLLSMGATLAKSQARTDLLWNCAQNLLLFWIFLQKGRQTTFPFSVRKSSPSSTLNSPMFRQSSIREERIPCHCCFSTRWSFSRTTQMLLVLWMGQQKRGWRLWVFSWSMLTQATKDCCSSWCLSIMRIETGRWSVVVPESSCMSCWVMVTSPRMQFLTCLPFRSICSDNQWLQREISPKETRIDSADNSAITASSPSKIMPSPFQVLFASQQPNPLQKMQSYDELIKIMLVGDSSVGKTSIIRAYCHPNNPSAKSLKPTVGLDYGERLVNIKGRNVLVQIWDTAGQERYQALTPSFYRSAMGILLVFSVTDKSSFNSVQLWMRQIRQYAAQGVPIVILCNKIDISTKEVNDIQCKALEKRHKVRTLNTSVVSNHNIADAVFALYEKITEQKRARPKNGSEADTLSKEETVRISTRKKESEGWCKC